MCGVSVIAFAPCREVAFEEGDEVFRGEAVGLFGEALHAAEAGSGVLRSWLLLYSGEGA